MFQGIRKTTKIALQRLLDARARTLPQLELAEDAWVVAPHPDDETLGCGGTIAEKIHRGARIRVVFVSDGSESHVRWMDKAELSARRKAEGLRACGRLGVRPEDVHYLDLPDGKLTDHVERGAASLARLFSDAPAEQFFIPHRFEPPADHAAAAVMAMQGLRAARSTGAVFEYPVWMWATWPWIPVGRDQSRVREVVSELRWRVDVRSQITTKREALACHETQTQRASDTPEWPVLSDVAGGAFLECFFSGAEYFHRSTVP
jgi:LmbE family N-acetylglucosaminyl deacetylase